MRIKEKIMKRQFNELHKKFLEASKAHYDVLVKLNAANAHISELSIQVNKPQTDNFLWKLRYDNLLLEIKKLNNRIAETVEQDKS